MRGITPKTKSQIKHGEKMNEHPSEDYIISIKGVKILKDEQLNKITATSTKPKGTVEDYFHEWEDAIQELSDKEVELINLKEIYREREQEIIATTDFKELYGANNEKVRKNHIEKTLQAMTDAKHDLEISIDYLKRRIDFIKNLMNMQRSLIESGVLN